MSSARVGDESLERALALAAHGEPEAACREFEGALADAPGHADAWNVFAHALAATGRDERADAAFGAALRLNPHLLTATYGRAQQRLRLQDPRTAESLLRTVVGYRAHVATSYHGLATALTQLSRFPEAVAAYEEWQQLTNPGGCLPAEQDAARRRGVPPVLLAGMQKSATEYTRAILLDATRAPLVYPDLGTSPRNFLIPSLVRQLARGGCVARVHLDASPHNLAVLRRAGIRRIALQLRDPRAATLSFTHHAARIDPEEFQRFAGYHRPPLPSEYQSWDLREQLSWMVRHYFPGALRFAASWHKLLERGSPDLTVHVSTYEALARDPRSHFEQLFAFFGLSRAPLAELLAARPPEAERNFRSGDPDAWHSAFSEKQASAMHARLPDALLERFGWS